MVNFKELVCSTVDCCVIVYSKKCKELYREVALKVTFCLYKICSVFVTLKEI